MNVGGAARVDNRKNFHLTTPSYNSWYFTKKKALASKKTCKNITTTNREQIYQEIYNENAPRKQKNDCESRIKTQHLKIFTGQ